jgi:putative acetyltransferase
VAVRAVNERAFGQAAEADVVDALRGRAEPFVSLVGALDGRVVGHILFTPVSIVSDDGTTQAMALGPMAVLPALQRQGIGSQLVRAGLEECRKIGQFVVFVLGHPTYYPRFGFEPAPPKGLTCKWEVSDEVFMVIELVPGALVGLRGLVRYADAFKDV